MPSAFILGRTRSATPPSKLTTVVILLSHVTKAEMSLPSTRVDSVLPYGSDTVIQRFAVEWGAQYDLLCIFLPCSMFHHQARPTVLSNIIVGHAPYGVITSWYWSFWLAIDGIPAGEMYPRISSVSGSVELLTEANSPGTFVTTELHVLARSALW